ncbi:MAG: IS110 family transposase, partial [Lachnospiraceae bacterium]|nr:IS110 family transposase [Lachnospiraceae bacterium]
MNIKGKKKKNQVVTTNIFEQQELLKKAGVVRENLTASTWRELETNGKFDKNAKLSFINDDMLILGCDVGSETHYLRAIDTRGRELSKSAFPFGNDSEGFQSAKEWAVKIAAENGKKQIVLGLEPTGHYWFCLATWMISNGISVV